MRPFSIFYGDGTIIHGEGRGDWISAPALGVQVVVEWRVPDQEKGELRWAGVTDRVLWTGEDEYDPFGWGVKYGSWMYDFDYHQLWEQAAHGR